MIFFGAMRVVFVVGSFEESILDEGFRGGRRVWFRVGLVWEREDKLSRNLGF